MHNKSNKKQMSKQCKLTREQLPELCFGELNAFIAEEVHLHLISCEACMNEYLELAETLDTCRGHNSTEELKLDDKQRTCVLEAAAAVSLEESRREEILLQAAAADKQNRQKLKKAEANAKDVLDAPKTIFYKNSRFLMYAGSGLAACFVAALILPNLGRNMESFAYAPEAVKNEVVAIRTPVEEIMEEEPPPPPEPAVPMEPRVVQTSDPVTTSIATPDSPQPGVIEDAFDAPPSTDDSATTDLVCDVKAMPNAPASAKVFGGRSASERRGALATYGGSIADKEVASLDIFADADEAEEEVGGDAFAAVAGKATYRDLGDSDKLISEKSLADALGNGIHMDRSGKSGEGLSFHTRGLSDEKNPAGAEAKTIARVQTFNLGYSEVKKENGLSSNTGKQSQRLTTRRDELDRELLKNPYDSKLTLERHGVGKELAKHAQYRKEVAMEGLVAEADWKWDKPISSKNLPARNRQAQANKDKAMQLISLKRYSEAVEALDDVLVNDPFNAEATHMKRRVEKKLQESGRDRRSATRFDRMAEIDWKWSNRLREEAKEGKAEEKNASKSELKSNEKRIKHQKKLEAEIKKAEELARLQALVDNHKEKIKKDAEAERLAEEKFLLETKKFVSTAANDTSTFSIDVDTASFTAARELLARGQRPQANKIRVEEFLNYFDYHYLPPQAGKAFAVSSELSVHPQHADRQLLRVGVQAEHVGLNSNSAGNYVLLIDNSGSMAAANRLPAIQKALPKLQAQLNPQDKVTLMTFEGGQASVLARGLASNLDFKGALQKIEAGRETNLAEGLDSAYKELASNYRPHAFNRLILLSDGLAADENTEPLMQKVETYRRQGLMNSVIGVGARNYNDGLLEQLANRGDGSFLFASGQQDLENIFSSQFSAMARTVARDVKIQLQMNKDVVKSYRLIGYENRRMKNSDFRNDAKDAGEVGSGQSVTALYELQLHPGATLGETGKVRIRYKRGRNQVAEEEEFSLPLQQQSLKKTEMTPAQKLSYTVNAFAELLRNSGSGPVSLEQLQRDCNELRKHFSHDRRLNELQEMIRQARRLY